MNVRTRFAPSPTGFLHVGGVRTALFAWLLAQQGKKQGTGQFILRIEDTDKAREVSGSEDHIKESLKWLGLEWDEGPLRQSGRLDIYKRYAQKLIESGRAYADPYTPEQLEDFRAEAKAAKRPFLFRDHRPDNPPAWDGSMPLRFKSEPQSYKWRDEVMGDLSTGPEVIDDFILIKSDGYPTYNFAHIVDDYEMKITHVIRSQEFVSSMPKFLNLYDALEIKWPIFATLPYVLGPDGQKKLSKRDGAKDILDYRKEGYLPQALVSFLATLGWNDGTTQEVFNRDELIDKFSLNRVQKSSAKFDDKRLEWINGQVIRGLSEEELYKITAEFWPAQAQSADEQYKRAVLQLVQDRLRTLSDLAGLISFFFIEPDESKIKDLLNQAGFEAVRAKELIDSTIAELSASDFSTEDIQLRLNRLLEEKGTKPKELFSLVRIAISGAPASPELFGSLSLLGKEKSLARLQHCVDVLGS